MISIDEQIANLEDDVAFWLSPDGQDPKQLAIAQAILLSLRRLKRIEELMDGFPEINPGNYNDDDVTALNNWGIELVKGFSA